jgi:hypothetical protein
MSGARACAASSVAARHRVRGTAACGVLRPCGLGSRPVAWVGGGLRLPRLPWRGHGGMGLSLGRARPWAGPAGRQQWMGEVAWRRAPAPQCLVASAAEGAEAVWCVRSEVPYQGGRLGRAAARGRQLHSPCAILPKEAPPVARRASQSERRAPPRRPPAGRRQGRGARGNRWGEGRARGPQRHQALKSKQGGVFSVHPAQRGQPSHTAALQHPEAAHPPTRPFGGAAKQGAGPASPAPVQGARRASNGYAMAGARAGAGGGGTPGGGATGRGSRRQSGVGSSHSALWEWERQRCTAARTRQCPGAVASCSPGRRARRALEGVRCLVNNLT